MIDASHVGGGFPDLVIARNGRVVLVEVKDGTKPPSHRRLTEDEQVLHAQLALKGVQVRVIETVAQAVTL